MRIEEHITVAQHNYIDIYTLHKNNCSFEVAFEFEATESKL